MGGQLTISIDLELAWGMWDTLTPDRIRMVETAERPICAALLQLFDRYEISATWAVVAGLLERSSSVGMPAHEACWYAPDIIEQLASAKTAHEIGSHGGRHIYFDKIGAAEAQEDLEFAKGVHHAHGLPFISLVFPRNAVGHLDLLAKAGLRTFRGPDIGWATTVRRAASSLGKAANLADKMLPLPPCAVEVEHCDGMINVPGSMLLMGRNGARRFVLPAVTRSKLKMGLTRAHLTGSLFHLWFHPSNFYYRREEQFATLNWFLAYASNEAAHGRIEIRTMRSYASQVTVKYTSVRTMAS